MNSKIKVDKFVIVVFLLCMVCNMTMQAKAYESFKVSIYVRAYEVDKMKDIHWLDSTWNVISQQLEVDKIYLETHRDLLIVDDASKTVTVDGAPVSLTPREYGILCFLTQHAGQVFSISQIYEAVWQEPAYNSENTVAVHIRRIREKIEINPKEPKYLKVVWGIGYKMEKY